MDLGLFHAFQLKDTAPSDGIEWDMQVARWSRSTALLRHGSPGTSRWATSAGGLRSCKVAAAAR
jgi:hypothetical protein